MADFWLLVGTAAPVIIVADVVAMGSLRRTIDKATDRYNRDVVAWSNRLFDANDARLGWEAQGIELDERKSRLEDCESVVVVGEISIVVSFLLCVFAFFSAIVGSDTVPRWLVTAAIAIAIGVLPIAPAIDWGISRVLNGADIRRTAQARVDAARAAENKQTATSRGRHETNDA